MGGGPPPRGWSRGHPTAPSLRGHGLILSGGGIAYDYGVPSSKWTGGSRWMMSEGAEDVLARLPYLRHRCDLDLLVFFHRHPRVLLTSERLVALVGYDLKQIAASLETLIAAKVVTRTQHQTTGARMYAFKVFDNDNDPLAPLLRTASGRAGWLAIIRALEGRRVKEPDAASRSRLPQQHGESPNGE